MSGRKRLAAIDIGTVTTRLLVADVSASGISEVERSTDITHLGRGLASTGRLDAGAMAEVRDVIAGYAERIRELEVEQYRAVATSASRDASNGAELFAMLAAAGIDIDIVEGSEEAALAFSGATFDHRGENLLVVDCGGGSTELVFGDAETDGEVRVVASRSVDVGSRRMTDMFLRSVPPSSAEIDAAREWAAGELRPYFDRLDERPKEMIALAGTATTLVSVKLALEPYDPAVVHGHVVSGSEVSDIFEMLSRLNAEQRLDVVGLHPGRAPVIVAGVLILETVMALAGLDSMVVSEHDLLYGILLHAYRDLLKAK